MGDIQVDRDVEMKLRDGTRIYLDVYRPATAEPLPAVLAWSPYGKQGGHQEWDLYPGRAGVARSAVSGLPKSYWEGPDPAFWCANGYVLVNVDPRGAFESGGDVQWFSPLEAQDGYDVVEWAAAQDWCSGAVTMSGNSWLSGHAVEDRRDPAAAPGRDRPMGGVHRAVPPSGPGRRHPEAVCRRGHPDDARRAEPGRGPARHDPQVTRL